MKRFLTTRVTSYPEN